MKFSRLDLRLDVDGRIVNIEMQVNRETDFKERTLFYWSKLYSEELRTGEEYGELKQTICINIINFDLFDCEDYHSRFKVLETERHEVLTENYDEDSAYVQFKWYIGWFFMFHHAIIASCTRFVCFY